MPDAMTAVPETAIKEVKEEEIDISFDISKLEGLLSKIEKIWADITGKALKQKDFVWLTDSSNRKKLKDLRAQITAIRNISPKFQTGKAFSLFNYDQTIGATPPADPKIWYYRGVRELTSLKSNIERAKQDVITEKSSQLVKRNDALLNYAQRLHAYMFSSKIRPVIFGYHQKKSSILASLKTKIDYLSKETNALLSDSKDYRNNFVSKSFFSQQRHYKSAKAFSYNAISSSRKILTYLKKIDNDLSKLKRTKTSTPNKEIAKKIQPIFHSINDNWEHLIFLFRENKAHLADIQGRFQIEDNLVKNYRQLQKFLINRDDLQTGDVLLSFKSKKFLKTDFIAKAIAYLADCQATHVLLAAKLPNKPARMIDSHADNPSGGVELRDFVLLPGEVFIVLRPNISHGQKATLMRSIRKYVMDKTKYSMTKALTAVPTNYFNKFVSKFTGGYKNLPNVERAGKHIARFREKAGDRMKVLKKVGEQARWFIGKKKKPEAPDPEIFCSELVNEIFKDAGILLTPKSKYSDMIFPSDMVASPFLKYIGLIFDESEKSKEIITKYLSNIQI